MSNHLKNAIFVQKNDFKMKFEGFKLSPLGVAPLGPQIPRGISEGGATPLGLPPDWRQRRWRPILRHERLVASGAGSSTGGELERRTSEPEANEYSLQFTHSCVRWRSEATTITQLCVVTHTTIAAQLGEERTRLRSNSAAKQRVFVQQIRLRSSRFCKQNRVRSTHLPKANRL